MPGLTILSTALFLVRQLLSKREVFLPCNPNEGEQEVRRSIDHLTRP